MPVKQGEIKGWWYFDSVQEFWDTNVPDDPHPMLYVKRDGFMGQLKKGKTQANGVRELGRKDLDEGEQPDAIIVRYLQNLSPCRRSNYYRLPNPPRRTGKFDAFMDEVEEVASRVGCRFVYIRAVFNDFLPEKFERRAYRMIPGLPGRPHFIKGIFEDQ